MDIWTLLTDLRAMIWLVNDPVVLLWESQGNSFQIQKNLLLSSVFIEWEKTPKEIGDLTDFVHITR